MVEDLDLLTYTMSSVGMEERRNTNPPTEILQVSLIGLLRLSSICRESLLQCWDESPLGIK